MMISDLITKHLAKAVMSLLALLSATITTGAKLLFLAPLEKSSQGKTIIEICTALLGLLLLSLSYIFYLHFFKIRLKTRIHREFIFSKNIGAYTHKKTGQLYCGCCLLENIDSPLITLEHSWVCQRKGCSKEYRNPENPPPQQSQRRTISHGVESWVRSW